VLVIEIYTDPLCTISLGNSSIYTGFAGICNTATTPDSGLSIGIDFCSPNNINMSVYRFAVAGAAENWGDAFSCSTPDQSDARFSLKLGDCTPVFPCSTCVMQYFRLWDTQCNSPAPVVNVQQDRGSFFAGALACTNFQINTAGGSPRFQSREILSGLCNPRTRTGTPTCGWLNDVSGQVNCLGGGVCGDCNRYDVNTLSI